MFVNMLSATILLYIKVFIHTFYVYFLPFTLKNGKIYYS